MNDKIVLVSAIELQDLISNAVYNAISQVTPAAAAPPPSVKESDLITREEAKDLLRVKSIATIDNHVKRGTLKKYYLGSLVRFKRSDVLNFVNLKN